MLIESAPLVIPFGWRRRRQGKPFRLHRGSDKALTIPNKTSAIKDFLRNIRRLRSLLSHRRL